MKKEGEGTQRYGILYYQDPEDANIVLQETITNKPSRLKVVTDPKKLQQIAEKKEIVTTSGSGKKRSTILFPKTSEIDFKENYEGFRAKYPVGSSIIKIDRQKEEAIDITTLEGIIEIEKATKLEHLIAYRGSNKKNMFNNLLGGRLYYLEDENYPEKMVAQRLKSPYQYRGWYYPSPEEINAVMTSIKRTKVIKFNTESNIYPISAHVKEKKAFKTKFKKFDDSFGANGKSTVDNKDKIGKRIKRTDKELKLTFSEIEEYITPENLRAWSTNGERNTSPFVDAQRSLKIVMYYVDKINKRLIKHRLEALWAKIRFK